jgi:hypothetical protein
MDSNTGREIGFADLGELAPLLAAHGGMFSEYCFPNIYLFRDVHGYRFSGGPLPVIRGRTYDNTPVVLPLFDVTQVPVSELKKLLGADGYFYPVEEAQVKAFDPNSVNASWNDDDSDYVYRTEHMAAFTGALLKKKRNQATRFVRTFHPAVRPFSADALNDAGAVLDQWFEDVEKPWADTDYRACRDALDHWQALGLFGIVCHDGEGEAAGFLLAGKVRDDVAAVHFAKGKRKYDGVFPYMFNQLAATVAAGYRYLNFEQDLGKEGFRRAKKSFAPEMMLRKYRLAFR